MIAAFSISLCVLSTSAFAADSALSFTTETVDARSGTGQYASIAMDSQGRIWIGYRRVIDASTMEYCVAVRESGGWSMEVAYTNTRRPTRLVLMPGDVPGVAWPASSGVTFLSRPGAPGTQWVEEPVSNGFAPWAAQIECDAFGRVHAYNHWSFHNFGNLEYSMRDGSGWRTEPLDWSSSIFIAHNAKADIAVPDDGSVHMAIVTQRQSATEVGMEYWQRSGGSWSSELLPDGDWPSIVVTPLGPIVTYHDFATGTLRFEWRVGGTWVPGTIDQFSSGLYSEIVQDIDGTLHVAYYKNDTGDLRYAVRKGGAWELHTVDADGNVGAWSSVVLDVNGHPHFAYQDAADFTLKYATLDLPTPVEVQSWGALKAIFEQR